MKKIGQATIWILLAIILVATMLIFFFFNRAPRIEVPYGEEGTYDVESFITQCVREHVDDVVDIILPQGGFVNPENSVFFDETNIEYLCENIGFYEPCINQHPMLLNEMKLEIENYIEPRVKDCLDIMEDEFQKRGAEVIFADSKEPEVEVDFGEDRVFLDVKKKMTITKEEDIRTFERFEIEIANPLYNLASIAIEIASQEATYCYFEYVGYSILYPRYKITKYTMSEPTKIYTIKDTKSGKMMNIAVRGCAIPPGF
jgi:hypothetical protein